MKEQSGKREIPRSQHPHNSGRAKPASPNKDRRQKHKKNLELHLTPIPHSLTRQMDTPPDAEEPPLGVEGPVHLRVVNTMPQQGNGVPMG